MAVCFLSFLDRELLMLELKYKQHSEDFNRINNYQIEHGLIAVVENLSTSAMEVDSGLKLPAYSQVENMMDDTNITLVDFMSRFEKIRVDEVSIDDAEDDICFNAKDAFEECTNVCLFRLRFTEDENTNEWEKRKVEYTPASPLPIEFQELLNGDFGSSLSFLFALHPQNINKEIMTVIGSAHIFADKNHSGKSYIQLCITGSLIRKFSKTSGIQV